MIVALVLFACLALVSPVAAAPAFDAAVAAVGTTTATSGTTKSWSHTTAGTNRVLYVACSGDTSTDINVVVTFDAQPMTLRTEVVGQQYLAVYRLALEGVVTTGAKTVAVTWDAYPSGIACASLSYTGVHQTTPDDTPVTSQAASGGSLSDTTASAAGDLVLNFASLNVASDFTTTPGASQTERADVANQTNGTLIASSEKAGATSVTMTYTFAGTRWAHAVINVNAVTAAVPLSVVSLTAGGSPTDGVTFTTDPHTMHGGALGLITIWSQIATGSPSISTVSGHGCSWSEVVTRTSTVRSQSTYRCTPSGDSTGAITVTYAAPVLRAVWTVAEALGADTSGTGCTGGIVQCPVDFDGTGLDLVATLAAFSDSANRPYIVGTSFTVGTNVTAESGWTELSDFATAEAGRMASMWRDDTTDLTGTLTWDSGTNAAKLWVALEIKAAESGGGGGGGTTYYVTKTGTGANCTDARTEATAHNTIAEGLACLASGDTLIIGPGEWNEVIGRNLVPSGTGSTEGLADAWPTATTVRAKFPAVIDARAETVESVANQTILKPLTQAACTDGLLGVIRMGTRNWIIVNGLVLDANNVCFGAYRMDDSGCSPNCTSHHHRLINMIIRNGAGSVGGVGLLSAGDVNSAVAGNLQQLHLKNSIVHDMDADSTFPNSGNHLFYDYPWNSLIEESMFYRAGASGLTNHNNTRQTTIRNNRFRDIGLNGNVVGATGCGVAVRVAGNDINVYNNVVLNSTPGCEDGGLQGPITVYQFNTPNNAMVINNVVYGGLHPGDCIRIGAGATNAQIRNNICFGGVNDIISDAGTNTVLSNNRCASGCATSADPLFVNAAAGNFHLQATSTMIDAGATSTLFSTDFEGDARPQGAAWDIGVDEAVISPASPSPPSGFQVQ